MNRKEVLAKAIKDVFTTGRYVDGNLYIHFEGHEIAFDSYGGKGYDLWVDGVRTVCKFEKEDWEEEFIIDSERVNRWAEIIILYYLPA